MQVLMSCVTSKTIVEIPEIDFPTVPISTEDPNIKFSAVDNFIRIDWIAEGQYALIPIDKWEELVKYFVDVNAAKKKYKALQKNELPK